MPKLESTTTLFEGVRMMLNRNDVPARLRVLVGQIENDLNRPIERVDNLHWAELRRLLQLVDGQMLVNCIVMQLLSMIDVPETEPTRPPERSLYEDWREQASAHAELVLLHSSGRYYAFDATAERLAAVLDEHLANIRGHVSLSLRGESRPAWEEKLREAQMDVVLIEGEDDDRFPVKLLADPDPLDHDGDGKKGGSKKGKKSTRAKGAAKKRP